MAHEGKSVADKKKNETFMRTVSHSSLSFLTMETSKKQKPLTTSIKPLQLKKASKNAPQKKPNEGLTPTMLSKKSNTLSTVEHV